MRHISAWASGGSSEQEWCALVCVFATNRVTAASFCTRKTSHSAFSLVFFPSCTLPSSRHPLQLSLHKASRTACARLPRPLPSPPPHIMRLPTSDKASSSLTHQVSISQRAHNTAPLRHLGLVVLLLFPRRRSSRLPSLKGPLAVMTTADECADSHNLLLFHPSSL